MRHLGLSKYVTFTGHTDPVPYYKNASLMLLTSPHEGFPLVISEAHSYGVPVVMMNLRYLENAKRGCVQVDKNNVNQLASEAVKLLKNDSYNYELGKDGYDSLEQFSNEKITQMWMDLFQKVLNGEKFK